MQVHEITEACNIDDIINDNLLFIIYNRKSTIKTNRKEIHSSVDEREEIPCPQILLGGNLKEFSSDEMGWDGMSDVNTPLGLCAVLVCYQ